MQDIHFVRTLRYEGHKRGMAIDKAGKRWRGFFANDDDIQVRLTGRLGSIGLCWSCGCRVYEGWECDYDDRDLCDHCVVLPPDHLSFYVPDPVDPETAQQIEKEFTRNASFSDSTLSRLLGIHPNAS